MLDKKISLSNSAAKITSVKLESNNLITYFTEDAHNLFVGALVSISGVTGGPTGATQPNPVVSNVYRIDNPTTFTVYSTTAYTATSFPATFTSSGLVKAAQGALSGVKLSYAQPVKAVRPTFFNFISPTITSVASGNKVLLSWDASGIANPNPIITIGRYDSSNTLLSSVAGTSATITSISNTSGVVTYVGSNTFIPGQTVSITGASSTAYNVTLPVATATAGAFTISTTATGTTSTASAVAATPTIGSSVIDPTGTDLVNGAVYNYRIIVANSAGSVNASTSVTTLFVNAPTSVTAISATNVAGISISWPLPVATATVTGYRVQRSVDGGAYNTSYATSATNTYSDTSVTGTQSFTYKIVALADYTSAGTGTVISGTSVASTTITPTFIVPPVPTAAPTASTANSITVTWSAPASSSTITGYSLQRSSNGGSTWSSDLTLTSPTATTYVDSSAVSSGGLSYTYRLSASNSSITSDYTSSGNVSSYFLNYVSLSASNTSLSTTSVTISGSYQSNPTLTGYNIQRSTSAGSGYTDIVATNYSTQLPYIDTTVAQGTTYYYTVVAKNAQLTSETSASVSVTTRSLPAAPVLTTSNTNAFTNQLSWTAPSSSFTITDYTVERSLNNSTWTGIYTGNTLSFTDTGLTQNTTYYYRVRANTAAGAGANSLVSTRATRTSALRRTTFTSSGTWTKPTGVTSASYLVVGGGGNGGASLLSMPVNLVNTRTYAGGGGGAGGVRTGTYTTTVAQESLTITVGAAGQSSVAFGVTAAGGGNGGCTVPGLEVTNGAGGGGAATAIVEPDFGNRVASAQTGSSGGGTGWSIAYTNGVSITSDGVSGSSSQYRSSGGGGAGAGGNGGSDSNGSGTPAYGYSTSRPPGGTGVSSSLSGSTVVYSVGGNGGLASLPAQVPTAANGAAGATPGSGGAAGNANNNPANTTRTGGAGAAGIVIVTWND
jgi:hypothetical protein